MTYLGVAHADDSSVLHFPDERAVFSADILQVKRLPGGLAPTIGSWIDALSTITALDFEHALTGHALSGTKEDAMQSLQYMLDISKGVAAGVAAGRSLPEIQRTLTLDAYKGFERWDTIREAHIAAVYATMGGSRSAASTDSVTMGRLRLALRQQSPMAAFKTRCAVALLAGLAGTPVLVQTQTQQDRTQDRVAFPAHTIIGNLHYVGTGTLNSYLITTPQGHILINTNYEDTVPLLRASVEKLGFKLTDIKIILGSHAHPDHMQADAMRQGVDWRRNGHGDGAGRAGAQGDEGAEREGASDRPRPQRR